MDVSSHEDSSGEFCCAGGYFFNEVFRIDEQGSETLITGFQYIVIYYHHHTTTTS